MKETDTERRLRILTELTDHHANMIHALHQGMEYIMDEILTDEQRTTLMQRAAADKEEGKEAPRILIP